jgi:hypothetical protein
MGSFANGYESIGGINMHIIVIKRHYNVRLICSMLAIIPKFHISLEVNNPLDVWSVDHILFPMS